MTRGIWVFLTVDPRRGIALLRGDGARQVIDVFGPGASGDFTATYSQPARGWVIPERLVADVVAYCEHRRELVVVTQRKPESEAS